MRRLRPHLTYANIVVTLLAIGALTGGVAYAADTIGSTDIIDESILSQDVKNGEVKSADIGSNQILSADVRNGQLNDEDVAQGTFVNFSANIGSVTPGCTGLSISGINAQGDHLLLTPSDADSNASLRYTAMYVPNAEFAELWVCNSTGSVVEDGITHFNLLVIDAQ